MRKRAIATFAASALALAVAPAPGLAQSTSGQDLTPDARGAYIAVAGAVDAFEIRSGELALEKAQDPRVRALAQSLVDEHRQAIERLKDVVGTDSRLYLEPPAMLPFQWEWLRDLEDESGSDFDEEYVEQRIEAHEIAVDLQRHFAASGHDPALKAYAESALPVASSHLEQARRLEN